MVMAQRSQRNNKCYRKNRLLYRNKYYLQPRRKPLLLLSVLHRRSYDPHHAFVYLVMAVCGNVRSLWKWDRLSKMVRQQQLLRLPLKIQVNQKQLLWKRNLARSGGIVLIDEHPQQQLRLPQRSRVQKRTKGIPPHLKPFHTRIMDM
jgi:hypothetical protein